MLEYESFKYFPEKFKTKEICEYASQKWWQFKHIKNPTRKMCIIACRDSSLALENYPKPITKNMFKIISSERLIPSYLFYFYYYRKKFIISNETVFYLKNSNLYFYLYNYNLNIFLKKNLSYYYF
jgi:hypothetical protein